MDRAPGVAEDEKPVADDVDEVCGDESHGDGANVVEGLQVAAEGEVEEERGCSIVERTKERYRTSEYVMIDRKADHHVRGTYDDEDEREREADGEKETMDEPTIGLVEATCAVGLGEKGIQAQEDAGDAEGDGVVENLSQGSRRDGQGGVGHVPDHDRVHDAHDHPTDLREDEREGKR